MTVDLSTHADDTIRGLWTKVQVEEAALRELYNKAQTVLPPNKAQLEEILKTSDDPQVSEYRAAIARATEALTEAQTSAEAYILSGYQSASPEEVEKIKADFRAKRQAVSLILNLIKSIAEQLGIPDVGKTIDEYEIPSLKGSGSSTTGTGVPRARINAVSISLNGQVLKEFEDKKATLSSAALFMKVRQDQVLNGWLEAAGVTMWQQVDKDITFEVTNEASGLTYEVTIEPFVAQ